MRTTSTTSRHQRGAALFMALIFLLILTILGVFGMNMSRMENLMAGNSLFQTTALSEAERTLVIAEREIDVILLTPSFTDWNSTGDAFYDGSLNSTDVIEPSDNNWGFTFQAVDASSRYVIEYAGPEVIQGNDGSLEAAAVCPAANCVWIYLATAQAESSRGAKRTVQSVYVSTAQPN